MFKMHFMKIIHSNSLSNLDLKIEKLKYNQLIWTKVEVMMIV